MQYTEIPVTFVCQGENLLGIIHLSSVDSKIGVVIVVGGPQYRVGSHRQFVLLARHLAVAGFTTMRFDVRGMGDSTGEQRCFDRLDDDIRTAIDHFLSICPQIKRIVIWGLCDAASAALFYAHQDHRVRGLVLLNPWVFTEQGAAKTYLKYYYFQRFLSLDFWKKIASFDFDYKRSLKSLILFLIKAKGTRAMNSADATSKFVDKNLTLPIRMRECLRRFSYPVLLILSGRDLTAKEFTGTITADLLWQELINNNRVSRRDFEEADHTFSSSVWRDQVAKWTVDWIKQI